jgi:membrane protease YdiL (CAAX protease family)
MIGSQLFSFASDRNRLAVQTAVLAALLLVRGLMKVVINTSQAMGYSPYAGHFIFYVAGTYALSYIFFLTIPAEERHLYHLTLPNKKIIKTTVFFALLCVPIQTAVNYFNGCVFHEWSNMSPIQIILSAIFIPIIYIGVAVYQFFLMGGLLEESLLRGFFWGYLKKFRVSDFSILCISAILFWAGHYFHAPLPGSWISNLVAGLVFGAVAWKTRSLFAAAAVHACCNATTVFFTWNN